MASDYDRYVGKETLFGQRKPALCGSNLLITDEEVDAVFSRTVKGLAQKFYLIPQSVKEAHLVYLLKTIKLKKSQQCIIFTQTCRKCHFLALMPTQLGFDCAMFHS